MVLPTESVDEILWCDQSNKPLWQYYHTVLPFSEHFIKRNFILCLLFTLLSSESERGKKAAGQ